MKVIARIVFTDSTAAHAVTVIIEETTPTEHEDSLILRDDVAKSLNLILHALIRGEGRNDALVEGMHGGGEAYLEVAVLIDELHE